MFWFELLDFAPLFYPAMASLAAAEPAVSPGVIPAAESIVPASIFAPDRGCVDDPTGEEGFEDGEGTNGESADHLDLSNKVGLTVKKTKNTRVHSVSKEAGLVLF